MIEITLHSGHVVWIHPDRVESLSDADGKAHLVMASGESFLTETPFFHVLSRIQSAQRRSHGLGKTHPPD